MVLIWCEEVWLSFVVIGCLLLYLFVLCELWVGCGVVCLCDFIGLLLWWILGGVGFVDLVDVVLIECDVDCFVE